MIYGRIAQETNGITVGTLEDNGQDMDVVVKNSQFEKEVTTDMIADLMISAGKNSYRIGDFMQVSTENAINKITRKDGDITITL